MRIAGNSELMEKSNVIHLFSSVEVELPDPLQELLMEGEIDWDLEERLASQAKRILVSFEQFPDQSIYTLEQQLASLNQSMLRLKFYMSDLEDLLPR